MKRFTRKTVKDLMTTLEETRDTLLKEEKTSYPYTEWEHKRTKIQERLTRLPEYIHQATEILNRQEQKMGRPPKLDLEQKANLYLMVRFLNKSNRMIEESLCLLQPFLKEGVDLSYKYIERLYSDPEVKLVMYNVFILLLKDETDGNLENRDAAGDGSGYGVSVENYHYRSSPQKHGKAFLHFFSVIDIVTGLYLACGFSRVSEMDAFQKALGMLKQIGVSLGSIRLDKYFSSRRVIELFDRSVSLFLIPKVNFRRFRGWADILTRMAMSPVDFLKQYYYRNLSESAFSADKDRFGRTIRQQLEDRQASALFSNTLLHNVFTVRINHK